MMANIILIVGVGALFVALVMVLVAFTVMSTEVTGVRRSLAAIEAIGAAPANMRKELEPSFIDRVITPLLARLGRMGQRLTATESAARIRHSLDVAGNPTGWTVDRVVSLKVAGFLVALVGSLFMTGLMGVGFMPRIVVCVGLSMLGYVVVNLILYSQGQKRTEQLGKDLPDAIDLLSISVEAGLGFDGAMSQVARNTEGPVGGEFARVLQEMQIGMARGEAMRSLGERTTLPELRGFANAMTQADAFGIPVAKVLRVQSLEMRTKRRQRAEEKAQKVAVKVLLPLMVCILPVLFIVVLGPTLITLVETFSGQ